MTGRLDMGGEDSGRRGDGVRGKCRGLLPQTGEGRGDDGEWRSGFPLSRE